MILSVTLPRRTVLGGILAAAVTAALPGCASTSQPVSLAEAVRRLLLLSSERAFARLVAPGAYWDQAITRVGLGEMLGTRGDVLSSILTSALFKSRVESVVADIALDASYRAAPVVDDVVRVIGIQNAAAIVTGRSGAATAFLRQNMGTRLVDAVAPGVADALRVVEDPIAGDLLAGLTGVDVAGMSRHFSNSVENLIWQEISNEELAIRADPASTRDPVLMLAFGAARAL